MRRIKLGLWKDGGESFFRSIPWTGFPSFPPDDDMLLRLQKHAIGLFGLEKHTTTLNIQDYNVTLFYQDTQGDKVWLCTRNDWHYAVVEYESQKKDLTVWAKVRRKKNKTNKEIVVAVIAGLGRGAAERCMELLGEQRERHK